MDHPDRDLCTSPTACSKVFGLASTSRAPSEQTPSAAKNSEPVAKYLQKEVEEQRIIGPLPLTATNDVHICRFGVIPKRHQSGKWRLIIDLLSPHGASVNDGISKDLYSLQYESVDDAARIVMGLGRGTQLAKIDIAYAYRNVLVHPADRHLLGMQWKGNVYVDTFGMRSAPKILCALSDTLEWILLQAGISACLHYIDDFLTVGAPDAPECQYNLKVLMDSCASLGIPLAKEKIKGPTSRLTFLGILFNTVAMTMQLPEDSV